MCIIFSLQMYAQTYVSMRPNWTFNTPKAEHYSYEYYVSKGIGTSEIEARKDAFVKAVVEMQSRIGVWTNSEDIFKAFQTGQEFNTLASNYKIPMKEVCNFSERSRDGKWYYYQLLQIAINGNTIPQFKPFTGDCYDFSKAIETRRILENEYKDQINAQKIKDRENAKQQKKEDREYDRIQRKIEREERINNSNYVQKNRNRYIAWSIAGTGYPWNLITGIEFRGGKTVGIGLYGNIGMNFTNIDYSYYYYDGYRKYSYYNKELKTAFRYAGGLKFYPYKGLFIDCGYGTIAKSKTSFDSLRFFDDDSIEEQHDKVKKMVENSHGILFHTGYNLVTDLSGGAGFFLGVSAGASYDVINKVFAPSINVKIGVAFGLKY